MERRRTERVSSRLSKTALNSIWQKNPIRGKEGGFHQNPFRGRRRRLSWRQVERLGRKGGRKGGSSSSHPL
jgi:hypothetical protein